MNLFKYTDSNKRYYTLNYFYNQKFNSKVFKISLNAGFTCPNIDGKVGTGGCIYCSHLGSGDYAGNENDDLIKQFNDVKNVLHKKWKDGLYIGYFQAHTNTYAKIDILKKKYECILKLDNVIGLSIATRPDSIDLECLNYLNELNKKTFLTVELGLQTIHEKTSTLINRCHTLKCFEDCVFELRKRNINVVVHIINGLPYETKEMMIETIKYLNRLDIQGIKIHMLHILKNTKLALMYDNNPFPILSKEEYVALVCDQLENLRSDIVINRITGDPKEDDLIEPTWVTKKFGVLNEIDKLLEKRKTYQGFNLNIDNQAKKIINEVIRNNELVIDSNNLYKDFINKYYENIKYVNNYNLINKISLVIDNNLNNINNYLNLLNKKGLILIKTNSISDIDKLDVKYDLYEINNEYLIVIKRS